MKARKVKGLDPDGALADNAERVLRVRLDELYGFAPAALDPSQVEALHDMRIAAKRLRYALEVAAPVLGAERGIDEAKALQEVLGEVHDCDVMLEVVRTHARDLRAEDASAVRSELDPDAEDLAPDVMRLAPNRARYRGLEALATYLRVRRDVLFVNFVERWSELEREGFRETLERSIAERPEVDKHSVQLPL